MANIDKRGYWTQTTNNLSENDAYHEMINKIIGDFSYPTKMPEYMFRSQNSKLITFGPSSARYTLRPQSKYWTNPWPERERMASFLVGLSEDLWILTGLDIYTLDFQDDQYEIRFHFRKKEVFRKITTIKYDLDEIKETPIGQLITELQEALIENLAVVSDQMMEEGDPEGEKIALQLLEAEKRTHRHETYKAGKDK